MSLTLEPVLKCLGISDYLVIKNKNLPHEWGLWIIGLSSLYVDLLVLSCVTGILKNHFCFFLWANQDTQKRSPQLLSTWCLARKGRESVVTLQSIYSISLFSKWRLTLCLTGLSILKYPSFYIPIKQNTCLLL